MNIPGLDPAALQRLVTVQMPYGKHKGCVLADLPGNYLNWFAQRYGQHIQAEEGTAYPSAQALLGEGDLRTMGLEMAGRRRAS